MKSLGVTLLVAVLAACSAPPGNAQLDEEPLVSTPLPADRGDLLYQILIGEMAANRGDSPLAVESYLLAALNSTDPALAERATRVAIQHEDWDAAGEAGRHWASLEPDSMDVQRLLAGVYLRAGDATRAADTFERVLEMAGQSFDSGATSILAALQQEPDRALGLEVAQVLVDRHPDNAMGHFVLGQLAADFGDLDTALSAFDRSLAIQPAFGRAQLARAQVQFNRGEVDDALTLLAAHVQRFPADVVAHQGYAQMLVEAERDDDALEAMADLYAVGEDRAPLVYNLGLMALEMRALADARGYLERAVELDPSRHDAHYFLGRISDFEQDVDGAVAHYDRVTSGANAFESALRAAELVGRSSDLAAGRERLAVLRSDADLAGSVQIVLSESGLLQYHDDYDAALGVLDEGLGQYPGDIDLHYARGLLLARLGDERGFEREMRVVLEAEPDSAQALNALGYSLADRNVQLDEAERLIHRAIELAPDDAAIIDSMGWLHFRQGNLVEAQKWLERAYALLPDAEIAAHLIEVLWQLGEETSARDLMSDALTAHPDSDLLVALQDRIPGLVSDTAEGSTL